MHPQDNHHCSDLSSGMEGAMRDHQHF